MNHSPPGDKPEGRKIGWHVERTECLHEGKTARLRRDEVRIDGEAVVYEYDERADAVIIVPVTGEGKVVLIRQYRYPVDAWCLETPAGGCHDVGDLPLDEVVRKELREEIGAEAGPVEQIGWFYSSPSFTDEKAWIFIAWEVTFVAPPDAEETEAIQRRVLSIDDALATARSGEMQSAPCALALLRCEAALRARFPTR